MELIIENGDCLKLMKELPDKSVDLFVCDFPYLETNCAWDQNGVNLEQFWAEFRRLRKSKRTACIHFCSTKFGYTLIKSWEKGYKMDMVWKKRNKTGGLQSRHRPMRNHEMVYFFYEQAPKYNRDKYHKRIVAEKKKEPPNPASVVEEKSVYGTDLKDLQDFEVKDLGKNHRFEPPNPASVVEEDVWGQKKWDTEDKPYGEACGGKGFGATKNNKDFKQSHYDPPNPASIVEEPVSMFESKKVFIGKRHHQTEKPLDILEFFLKYWTDEGDTVLDPTMGSGSTGVACKNLNRKFIGFELNEKIFEVAEKRLN